MTAHSSRQSRRSVWRAYRNIGFARAWRHGWMGLIMLGLLACASGQVLAGTTGAEFQPMFQLLTDWIGGYLGRSIAIGAFIIGVGYGAFAQRYLVALGGIFVALLVLIVPQVLNVMLTATI